MKDKKMKNDLYEYILKRHGYYYAKYEFIDSSSKSEGEKANSQSEPLKDSNKSSSKKIEDKIEETKNKIQLLKNNLLEEEKQLLNLYEIKKKK